MTPAISLSTTNRSDVPDAEQPTRTSLSSLNGITGPEKLTLVHSTETKEPLARRQVAKAYTEKLVEDYAAAAMRHARLYRVPDGTWVGEVVGLDGAWSEGETEVEASALLPDILFDWTMFKVINHDGDIPVVDGIDLNVL